MEFQRKVQDISKIVDSQWQANHQEKNLAKVKEEEKKHFERMFSIQDKEERKKEILKANSVEGKVSSLKSRMEAASKQRDYEKMRNFKNNFR